MGGGGAVPLSPGIYACAPGADPGFLDRGGAKGYGGHSYIPRNAKSLTTGV